MAALEVLAQHAQNQREAVASLTAIIDDLSAEASGGVPERRARASLLCMNARHVRLVAVQLVRYYEELVYGAPRTTWKWWPGEVRALGARGGPGES